MADLTRTIEILFEGTNNVGKTVTSIGRDIDGLSMNVSSAARPLADLSAAVIKLDTALAALAGTGLAYSYSESSKLQSAFTELKKVAGDNAEILSVAKVNAKDLSNAYGESAASILSSTANYVQAGYSVKEAMQLAKTGMDLVIAGGVDASESSEILIATLKGFKAPADEASRVIDILNEVSNLYATDVEQLGIGMAGISPIAKTMGFSFEETAGILTPVIEVFRSGDEAAMALKTGLLKLIDDTKPVKDALASIGVAQRDANGNLRSGRDILLDVSAAFQHLDEPQKLFVTQQLVGIEQSARMVEVFNGLAKSTEITAVAMGSAGSAAKEISERLNDPEVAINRLVESFKNLASSIGDDFQLAGTGVINGITAILNSLEDSVDDGAFDPLLNALNDFLTGVEDNLKTLAETLPDALYKVDYSGFLESLGNLKDTISSLFDGINFGDPESLAQAIQKVIDTLESLTNLSTGIAEVFTNIAGYISSTVDWFNDLDDETQETIGNLAGVGTAITAIAAPIGVLTTVLGGLSGALTAAAGAGALWLGLKMADEINQDLYVVDDTLTSLKKSAAEFEEEIDKLDGTNATMYKFFKGEDKETVLDELRTKLQLVNDKIKIIEDEQAGKDIFGPTKESANELQFALDHIAPKFQAIDDDISVGIDIKEVIALDNALAHIVPVYNDVTADKKINIDVSDAEKGLQTLEYFRESTGTWETIKIPVDTTQVANAKSEIEEIPSVKRLEIETDLKIEEIKAQAETIQKAMEFKAQINIEQIKADAEVAKAAFDSVGDSVSSTADAAASMFSSLADFEGATSTKWHLEDALKEQIEIERAAQETQSKLADAQVEYLKARADSLKSGNADIAVDFTGAQPHMEALMWEFLAAIQVRANEEGLGALLLGA